MGEQRVSIVKESEQMHQFVRNLLNDVKAMEFMLEDGWFESDIIRIGAEQEMVLVDNKSFKPAPIAMDALKRMKDFPWVETELAKFNLETNLTPRVFEGTCLSDLEKENLGNLNQIRKKLKRMKSSLVLTGILPTLRRADLSFDNLTPKKRYFALMEALGEQLLGSQFELNLSGIDELRLKHDSPLLEAVNTSFQVHLQVSPNNFVQMYNISQALAAPVMAIAANSPMVFGRRLWHETRIAMFQQAIDHRTSHDHLRERSPRVSFGNDWLDQSVMEIYREDIAKFRVLLAADLKENSIEKIQNGQVPKLRALQVHNSTVYRWNRPCYGISDNGKPHLRIENRVLPSGPTVIDEVANAALWLGAMVAINDEYKDIRQHMSWADVSDNFMKSAKFGIDSNFTWFKDKKIGACDLVLKELVPLARKGLEKQNIKTEDIDRYLGVIEERAKKHMNGARWQLRAYTKLKESISTDEALSILTASIVENQAQEKPVHTWELPEPEVLKDYSPSLMRVEDFMATNLLTVQKNDLIDLVAELIDWYDVKYLPVEDKKGKFVGMVSAQILLKYYSRKHEFQDGETTMVKDIMFTDFITVQPETKIVEAMQIMRKHKIGALPVVKNDELIGLITEVDFLKISGRLIERLEKKG